jgi:hypothetical protein
MPVEPLTQQQSWVRGKRAFSPPPDCTNLLSGNTVFKKRHKNKVLLCTLFNKLVIFLVIYGLPNERVSYRIIPSHAYLAEAKNFRSAFRTNPTPWRDVINPFTTVHYNCS